MPRRARRDPHPPKTTRGAPRRPRTPAAAKQAAYRLRLQSGVAVVPLPVTGAIVDYLARAGLLPPGREAASRAEIGIAVRRVLDRLARER